jgi:hypothetical protein
MVVGLARRQGITNVADVRRQAPIGQDAPWVQPEVPAGLACPLRSLCLSGTGQTATGRSASPAQAPVIQAGLVSGGEWARLTRTVGWAACPGSTSSGP